MSFGNRDNPYGFESFLEWRNRVDYYQDDLFLQKAIRHFVPDEFETIDRQASQTSKLASYRWRDFAEKIAWLENRPYMMHYDGHNHRIDRIVRPKETMIMEQEVFSQGLFSQKTSPWLKFVNMYLIYQNGEACISCPLTCTEGMVALLEKFADTPELKHVLNHCKEGIDGHFAIGAQYLSEIQGGSDVPSNLVEAQNDNGQWKLFGKKFFCSATHADYAVVTAKPQGSDKVALFIVPSWLPGNKEKEIRNGYTIDRIKWKMGTSELTTAEITYDGALAYPVGPLEKGVANVVGIVLTYSRVTVGIASAASMARAVREAKAYAGFRKAFGLPIDQFPMLAGQLDYLDKVAKRTVAGAFKVNQLFLKHKSHMSERFDPATDNIDEQKQRFDIRELVMLQKITTAWDSTDIVRSAMSVFGGHGVMEDFSSLPRLFRDAAINELWEGPRNVLLTQIHRDFQKAATWYSPQEFVENILTGANPDRINSLKKEISELAAYPSLFVMDDNTKEICRRWDLFCHDLFHEYQNLALFEVENESAGQIK